MLCVIFLYEILEDGPRFKQPDHFPVAECVCQSRNAAVRVDGEEPGLLLDVGRDVQVLRLVGEAELLERDGDLDPVGGCVGVEGDVGLTGLGLGLGHGSGGGRRVQAS